MSGEVLVGERERRRYVLDVGEIDYIESQGNYVRLHVGASTYLSRDSLKRLSVFLAGRGFVRIERSLMLNRRAVAHAHCLRRGMFSFTLSCGVRLRSGASYRAAIMQALPWLPQRSPAVAPALPAAIRS
jgi:two-component system, LytTR family, response regulator